MSKLYSAEHEYEVQRIKNTDLYIVKEDGEFQKESDNIAMLMNETEVQDYVLEEALHGNYGYNVNKNSETIPYQDILKEMQTVGVTFSAENIQKVTEQLSAPAYTEEQIQDFLKEQIEDLCTNEGMRLVMPSRGEALSSDFIMKSFNEYQEDNEGFETFSQFLDYQFIDKNSIEVQELDLLLDEIEDNALHQDIKLLDCLRDYLNEAFQDACLYEVIEKAGYNGISYELTDFLQDDYKLNLMLGTKAEENMDMGSIESVFVRDADDIPDGYAEQYFEKEIDNALTWLIHQQGHEVSEVYSALTKDMDGEEGFIASVVREIQDCPDYSMMELTVSVSASGQNLLDTLDALSGTSDKNLEFSKDSSVALFNEWQGTCSDLDIQPEKPIIIPADMVRNVQMEDAGKENNGYTLDETCGLIGEYWKGDVFVTEEQPELVHEDVSAMKEAFIAKNEQQKEQAEQEYDD